MSKLVIDPTRTVNMRQLWQSSDPIVRSHFNTTMGLYHPELAKAFPDESEIETADVYREYLADKTFEWFMLVLCDANGTVCGGIQYQIVRIPRNRWLRTAIWAEHIWLKEEARSFPNFRKLMAIAQEAFVSSGAQLVFFEFNDRAKMSCEQMKADEEAGLATQKREWMWSEFCDRAVHVAIMPNGRAAFYEQPAMGKNEPVKYLTLAFISLTNRPLADTPVLASDYMGLLEVAHVTIPGVELDTDLTVLRNRAEIDKWSRHPDSEQHYFHFVPLADTEVGRFTERRFCAKPSQYGHVLNGALRLSSKQRARLLRALTAMDPSANEMLVEGAAQARR